MTDGQFKLLVKWAERHAVRLASLRRGVPVRIDDNATRPRYGDGTDLIISRRDYADYCRRLEAVA